MFFIVWNNHLLMKRLYFDEFSWISFLLFFLSFLYLFHAVPAVETGAFHEKWKANLMITFKTYSIHECEEIIKMFIYRSEEQKYINETVQVKNAKWLYQISYA